jgi:ketosteroid isomerase-like protein
MSRTIAASLLAPLLFSTGVAGCASTPPRRLNPEQEAAIAEALLSTTAAYNAAWEALDVRRITAFHADDFTYYRRGVVDSDSHADFARAYHENVATQITGYWASASDTWVKVLGPDAGIVAFVFRGGVETPDGARHDYDGALTYVYERRGGEWRITHIHESAYLPESPQ